MGVSKDLSSDLQIKKQKNNEYNLNLSTLQKKDINDAVGIVRSPLNLHLQQNTKIALSTKRARRKKNGSVRTVEGMKVVQMNTLDVISVPFGTINGAQHLEMRSHVLNATNVPLANGNFV